MAFKMEVRQYYFSNFRARLNFFIVSSFSIFIFLFFVIFSLTWVYKSKTIIEIVDFQDFSAGSSNLTSSSISSFLGQSSNNISSTGKVALQLLESKRFFKNIYDIDFYLGATHGYKRFNGEDIFNKKVFSSSSERWIGEEKPVFEISWKEFNSNLKYVVDPKTNFVEISYTHQSPKMAQRILTLTINEINELVKNIELEKSQKVLEYIESYLLEKNSTAIQGNLKAISMNHLQKITRAGSTDNYVFEFIEPPTLPKFKSYPKRLPMLLLSLIFSFFLPILVILLDIKFKPREFLISYKDKYFN
jgi:hypothetical protein